MGGLNTTEIHPLTVLEAGGLSRVVLPLKALGADSIFSLIELLVAPGRPGLVATSFPSLPLSS